MKGATIGGTLDYARLADLHRPQHAHDIAPAARQLAAQGLHPRDIAQALRLTVHGVIQLLDHEPQQRGMTMKVHDRTSPAAKAGGPHQGDGGERDAAQRNHAREACANIEKARQPAEVLTADEAATLARSKGVAR